MCRPNNFNSQSYKTLHKLQTIDQKKVNQIILNQNQQTIKQELIKLNQQIKEAQLQKLQQKLSLSDHKKNFLKNIKEYNDLTGTKRKHAQPKNPPSITEIFQELLQILAKIELLIKDVQQKKNTLKHQIPLIQNQKPQIQKQIDENEFQVKNFALFCENLVRKILDRQEILNFEQKNHLVFKLTLLASFITLKNDQFQNLHQFSETYLKNEIINNDPFYEEFVVSVNKQYNLSLIREKFSQNTKIYDQDTEIWKQNIQEIQYKLEQPIFSSAKQLLNIKNLIDKYLYVLNLKKFNSLDNMHSYIQFISQEKIQQIKTFLG
ncbi:hypothetical protein PPERSA_09206 [Pseudocohnilembus persalinus]|uniref:Uncharacterized protein n=1 Tax=Pseudocohnilembus persalinus TaxID=266149 RepID=A0A0V0R4K0_PSEPJ|nr:hypothetical protein PPERSA_09206 [Pseudocohnilembus persalinus]|eukprot:KRX09322.1 hypothetical protein PPERSA_09206 [Pseudocohnilembus persalinus]